MVDIFSLVVTHAVLAIALWRMVQRDAMDVDPSPEQDQPETPAAPKKAGPRA